MPDAAPNPEYITEREAAREKLRQSIDALADRANLQVQMQKEPLKMLGGASAVGAVIGMVIGRQFRRSKKIYVDAASPEKHQRALIKAQSQGQNGRGIGGALIATLGTLAVKTLTERVLTPKLEELSNNLLEKAGQAPSSAPKTAAPVAPVSITPSHLRQMQEARSSVPSTSGPTAPAPTPPAAPPHSAHVAPTTQHPGVRPAPESQVEAKARGSEISAAELGNPNQH